MSAKETGLVLGGVPRADLLPPEIRAAEREKSLVRLLILGVIALAVLVVLGVGVSTVRALASEALLASEQERSAELIAEQSEYAEARRIANRVAAAIAARAAATTTEFDWQKSLDEISATLPAGVTLTSVRIDSITPIERPASAEGPLQEDWIATLTIKASSLTVPDVEAWLDDLENVTGFAGIAPPATVDGSTNGGYEVAIEVHLDSDAYLARFQDAEGN